VSARTRWNRGAPNVFPTFGRQLNVPTDWQARSHCSGCLGLVESSQCFGRKATATGQSVQGTTLALKHLDRFRQEPTARVPNRLTRCNFQLAGEVEPYVPCLYVGALRAWSSERQSLSSDQVILLCFKLNARGDCDISHSRWSDSVLFTVWPL
jgi:hypothetical protein